jgi:hypothetical protein
LNKIKEKKNIMQGCIYYKICFSKNKVHLYKRYKKIIDESEKFLQKLNIQKKIKKNLYPKKIK